jgi:uncharacterized protein
MATKRAMALALALAVLRIALPADAAAPIRVMILDGESGGPYHKWQLTTPVLVKELEETGLFQVDVVTAPPAGGDFRTFKPQFGTYRAIVLNYDAPDERWPAELKQSFVQYIASGGGLVVVHAADNAFPRWPAFNEMIGVGGWRGRTEQAGPMWSVQDGQLVADRSPGAAGTHGRRVPFQLTVRDANHPITAGLPRAWMHQGDELYARLRGPGKNMSVLATAHSDPSNNGSGRDEPILMALTYGKGRVFHTTLGHDVAGLSSIDFVVTFQRGAEWAATGVVTQKVPANFPTPTAVSYRADLAALDPEYTRGLDPLDAPVSPRADTAPAAPAMQSAETGGASLFSARCGFCHGRDAAGGEGGTDLTRSTLVAEDVRGDRIGPVVRGGRVDKGMPAFNLSDAELTAIVAFIHERKAKSDAPQGGRRGVDPADLETGSAEAGKIYFNGAGGCSRCHSPVSDLAGVATRLQGLALLQQMLYPRPARGVGGERRPASIAEVTVTLASGQTVTGKLAYRDEFTIALTDASGWHRSWPAEQVKFTVRDPLEAHSAQLAKYTDEDMHNVLAYLQTLR